MAGREADPPEAAVALDAGADSGSPVGEGDTNEPVKTESSSGHGLNGAETYRAASRIHVAHPSPTAGHPSPACTQRIAYGKSPGVLVRITGQPPLAAKIYASLKSRGHLRGQVFTVPMPRGAC